jgi:hypothetical protein
MLPLWYAIGTWHSLTLQRGSAELQRQIGQAMLAQHPGKRTLLSVLQIHFTDNQPPMPLPACDSHPAACGFVLSGGCARSPLTVYWEDTIAQGMDARFSTDIYARGCH